MPLPVGLALMNVIRWLANISVCHFDYWDRWLRRISSLYKKMVLLSFYFLLVVKNPKIVIAFRQKYRNIAGLQHLDLCTIGFRLLLCRNKPGTSI